MCMGAAPSPRRGGRLPQASERCARNATALIAALDGRRVAPGPAGAPHRGRRDVLPTGRNLFTADPRTLPTQTAMDLGGLAADEVIRALSADPRRDAARAGDRPVGQRDVAHRRRGDRAGPRLWAAGRPGTMATARVTGVEVLPTRQLGRARVDVTWRISGLFRDLFPAQIALLDAAVQAVAARDETDDENPLAAARRQRRRRRPRPHLRHRARRLRRRRRGPDRARADRAQIGTAYLDAASHAYGGADGRAARHRRARSPSASPAPICWCIRAMIPAAICSKAPRMLPSSAALRRPQPRSAARPNWSCSTSPIRSARARGRCRPRSPASCGPAPSTRASSQGRCATAPRGAAELAETVDRLVAFAQTTDAVPSALIDLVHDAYLADPQRARISAAGKSGGGARHRRAARQARAGAGFGIRAATTSMPTSRHCGGGWRMNADDRTASPRRLPGPVRSDADRRRLAGAARAPDATIGLDAFGGAVRGGAPPRQRHHRDHGARQHPGSRA